MDSSLATLNYNSLATAYFQGMVYTHGAVVAENDVTIVGCLVAQDNGSQSPGVLNGVSVNPGELHLLSGAHITYTRSSFFNGVRNLSGLGVVSVLNWHLR
jgi:hypothetical protein